MKKVLILGGTGAIGNNIVKLLKDSKQYDVYVTSRQQKESSNNIHYLICNALIKEEIEKVIYSIEKWDVIVDFMIYSFEEFAQRLSLFLNNSKHYLFFSSARVYCDNNHNKISEECGRLFDCSTDEKFMCSDDYAIKKAKEENFLIQQNIKNWTIVRPYITYDTYRFQLGAYEKEDWLYRVLNGKTVVFDSLLLEKETTMTAGYDVAFRIVELFLNNNAYGEIYNLASNEHHKWKEIIQMYGDVLLKAGFNFRIKIINGASEIVNSKSYQIKYDRMFNRLFDTNKYDNMIAKKSYLPFKTGIELYMNEFLKNPIFKSPNWVIQGKMDRLTNEKTNLNKIEGKKNKVKYFLYRHGIKK